MTTRQVGVAVVSSLCIALAPVRVHAQVASSTCPATSGSALPLAYAGPPTSAAISACDLMTRLYRFADDSMRGRRVGTPDHERATAMVAAEAQRLGLEPAGDKGTWYQSLPLVSRMLDTTSTIVVDGATFKAGVDFLANTSAAHPADFAGWKLMYGGTLVDTNTAPFSVPPGTLVLFAGAPQGTDLAAIQKTDKGKAWVTWYNTIRSRATSAARLNANAVRAATNPAGTMLLADTGAALNLTLTSTTAQALFGAPLEQVAAGTASKPFTLSLRYIDTPRVNRNVVARLRGADAKLRGQYIALGAHIDHLGIGRAPLDHDSVRAMHLGARSGAEGAASRKQTTEDDEYDRIKFLNDSLHKARPARMDSVYNGADDGGSGTVALLEIAESFARGSAKPKRSILFIWHTGTESQPALSGSNWFAEHPSVPADSIVAQITVDMIGRGEKSDEVGVTAKDDEPRYGNPDFVEVVGSHRRSSELAPLIERTNTERKLGLKLDYAGDADGHPEALICRNDALTYARHGIPSVWFTTGYHADFRQITDEAQYVRYGHMTRIVQLASATTLALANLDHRLATDIPTADIRAQCTAVANAERR